MGLFGKVTREVNNTSSYPLPNSATVDPQLDVPSQALSVDLCTHILPRYLDRQRISSITSLPFF
jgi:hypothetical protein